MQNKIVIFDIGNVFVRWAPFDNLRQCFPGIDAEKIWQDIRRDWLDLNRGKMSLDEAFRRFAQTTDLPREGFRQFCDNIMSKATYLADTLALQDRLKQSGVPLYYLSDNIKEVIDYYQQTRPFMQAFDGGVSSHEIGYLKPTPEIYQALLDRYDLDPSHCVFFDDLVVNIEGAKKMGLSGFVFTDAAACAQDLRASGLNF